MKKPSDDGDDWEVRRAQVLGLGERSRHKSFYPALRRRIAELERTERALRASEERLRLALRGAELGMWEWNVTSGEAHFDGRWCGMLGYETSELAPAFSTYQDLLHPEDLERTKAAVAQALLGGPELFSDELRLRHRDGRWVWVLAKGLVTERDPNGGALRVSGTHLDITQRVEAEAERLRLEAQIQHAQKLESLGVLAGGIAHDFNNLIQVILGNAELGLYDTPDGSNVHHNLSEIRTAAKRASELTNQMLAYSGKGRFIVEPLDLNELVEEMGRLLRVSVSKKAELRYDLAPHLPFIEVDATQLRQVVMNLVTNASDAFGPTGAGVIALSTGTLYADRDYLASAYIDEQLPEGRYAFIRVEDDGCGMSPETRERLFDPFYTTKAAGRGLGMAAVLGIVRGHHGLIKVDSAPGKGSSFEVLLPLRQDQGLQAPDAVTERVSADYTGLTALIADDEETVRSLLASMLRQLGLSILPARDGAEAVALYEERGASIDLVILDVLMPRMDGREAAVAIRRLDPDVRLLLCSGYDASPLGGDAEEPAFLKKPYAFRELREALAAVLDAGDP